MRNPFSANDFSDYYSPYLEDEELDNEYYGYDVENDEDDFLY